MIDYDVVLRGAAEILEPAQLAVWQEIGQIPRWQAAMSSSLAEASKAFRAAEGKSDAK